MMQSLYHSGVGWVNDILSVRLFFDADLEAASAIPHTVTDAATGETAVVHHRPLFAGGAPVRGFARVTAPPGRTVPHHGVTVRLDSGLFALDEINTRDLYSEEVTVAQPGDVTGTVDLPFEFRGTGPHALAESFEGSLFSIRHTATATVLRPWYTFHVAASAPFAVQRVHDIHRPYSEGGEGGEAGAAARGVDAQLALYGPQTLALDAFPADGGDCVLEFDKGCYELSEHIVGAITFTGLTAPVLLVKLAIVRIEYADSEVADTVVFDEAIMDARRWRARKAARQGAAYLAGDAAGADAAAAGAADPWVPTPEDLAEKDADVDLPMQGDVTLKVDLNLEQLDLSPTHVLGESELGERSEEAEDAGGADGDGGDAGGGGGGRLKEVSVRYFLRLTAYTGFDAESRRWNAQEVVLYRDRLYGSGVALERLPERLVSTAPQRSGAPVGASASAATLPHSVPLPQPLTSPFAATLLFGRRGAAAGGGAASPSGTMMGAASPRLGASGAALSPVLTAASGYGGRLGVGRGGFSADAEEQNLSSFLTKAVRVGGGEEGDGAP